MHSRGYVVEALSVSDSLQLVPEVVRRICRVLFLILLKLLSNDMPCVWMDYRVKRHERVSDEGSGEAQALFAFGVCAPAENTLENGKDYEYCDKQEEKMGKDCA